MNNFKLNKTALFPNENMTLDWSVNCCSVLVNVNEDERLWWRMKVKLERML